MDLRSKEVAMRLVRAIVYLGRTLKGKQISIGPAKLKR
jgi:hypothetical protein